MPYYNKIQGGIQNNMAKYKKRKDGRYCTSITVGKDFNTGKPIKVTVYGKTVAEVDRRKAEILAESMLGMNVSTKKITFKEYADKWVERKRPHVQYATYEMYLDILKNHSKEISYRDIKDLTKSDMQELINSRIDKPRTCRKIKATFNQIFEAACDDGIIVRNPIKNVILPKYCPNKKRALTEAENLLTDITEFTDRETAFVLIMKWCGLRPEECLALTKFDFNLKDLTLEIKFALEFIHNKPHIKETKTANSKRVLPLIGPLKTFIPYYLSNLPNDYLFSSLKNGELITEMSYKRMWESIRKKMSKKAEELKLEFNAANLTPYIFRHNYATLLNNLGVSDREIQYLMGHSTIQTTNKWYIHMDPSNLKALDMLETYTEKRLH